MAKTHHYRCPDCGKLCSVPWDAAWCTHHEQVQPHPPSWHESGWTRMLPITQVDSTELPPEASLWYVVESRNPYGYPNNEIPGDDKRTSKVIAGPMPELEAYYFADEQVRDEGIAEHCHSFRPIPGDLVKDYG